MDTDFDRAVADMVELRRWSRRLLWSVRSHWERRHYVHPGWAWIGLPTMLYNWVTLPRVVFSTLTRAGIEVRESHGVSLRRQLRQMVGAALRWGVYPHEYYLFALYRDDRIRLAPLILGRKNNGDSLIAAAGPRDPQHGKREFHERCRTAGLPTIPILAECSHEWERPIIRETDAALWGGDLFSKPATAGAGEGVRMWIRQPDGGWRDGDVVAADRDELLSILASSTRHAVWIVQPRVRAHSALAGLSPGALCTVRVNTVRDPASGRIELLFPLFKMPREGAVADKGSMGGIAAGVELSTGRVGSAYPPVTDDLPSLHDVHPDTGERIEGTILPHWEEILDLARRAHEVYPECPTGGWDLTITDAGAVLVEANEIWGCDQSQAANDMPIGLTPYPRHMLKYLKAAAAKRALARRF